MKGKTALFLAFVSLLFGCPPGGESGTVTLGDVSVTPVRGYNTTATFELKAAVQTNVEATLTIVVKDETGAEAANSGAIKVKAGNSTQTFSTKIEKFGNMKATFTLAAAGVETQTKSVDFEVLEGGVPSAEFGWPATGVYAGAEITISMKDVKADTAGTGEGTFKLSQAAFTMTKDGTPVEFAFPPLLNDDATLNQNVQITLPSEHGNYSITLSVTNTNNQTREKTVEFALADKVPVESITAEPSSFSNLTNGDTVTVKLVFTGAGGATPSDINVTWNEGGEYKAVLTEQTATTAVYNLTVLSTNLTTATATAADGSGKTVSVTFSDISGNKVPATKTIEGRTLNLAYVENFNNIEKVLEKWRADGWRSDSDKLKRYYWRPEALEMTEFEGRQVFTMFTREWGSRPDEDTTKTPYYPGQDQSSSNGNNKADEQWIAGGIHLQKNIVFGYIEARVRTARNSNQHWDAFWSYNSHKADGYTMEYEFDCMEAITATNLDVTTHFWDWTTPGVPGGKFYTTKTKKHPGVNLNNKWYKLALLWTPEKVIYYAGHDTLAPIAGFERDGTGLYGYENLDTEKKEIPLITRWKQGFKFTTELGAAYGGTGRPTSGTEDKYYIDYFAVYEIPVTQAQLAADIANGTASFDREQADNTASAFADIASEGNPIYVTVTPDANYTTASVKATWGNESVDLTRVDGESNRWMLTVTANMPQYFDFNTQQYGEKVTITPTIIENANAPALESATMNCDAPFGIEGETIEVTWTPTPSDAVITNVSVNNGYSYDRETHLLTLKAVDSKTTETVTFTFTTKENATKTAELEVTVYPDTYVKRNGVIYEPVKTVEDFSSNNSDVTFTSKTDGAWSTKAQPVITVNSLQPDGTQSDIMTIANVPDNSDNNCLVEMTINYSDTSAVRSIIAITNGANRPFWLLRNTYKGGIGGGTAFRAGPNSGDTNSQYTLSANKDEVLGYLINGAKQGETAQFFFNGTSRTVLMNNSTTIETAPSIKGQSFQFGFNKEQIGNGQGQNPTPDPGTITLKKIVFYKPVTE